MSYDELSELLGIDSADLDIGTPAIDIVANELNAEETYRDISKVTSEQPVYSIDIMDDATRTEIMQEVIQPENDFYDPVISTTDTLDGYVNAFRLNERTDIDKFTADSDIISIRSNFGEINYEWYILPPKKNKKKRRAPAIRKTQGSQHELNSQISFWVRSNLAHRYAPGEWIPSDEHVYKFKIFRTARIQLPGAKRDKYDAVLACLNLILDKIRTCLDLPETPRVAKFNVVMRDYKTGMKKPANTLINLSAMKYHAKNDIEPGLEMRDIKSDGDDDLVFLSFSTPVAGKPDKCTAIKIFRSGRMTILGALDSAYTRAIFVYIEKVIKRHWSQIVVLNGDVITRENYDETPNNILMTGPSPYDVATHRVYNTYLSAPIYGDTNRQ